MTRFHIYELRDPRDGTCRYIGCTTASLAVRLCMHVSANKRTTHKWMAKFVEGSPGRWHRPALDWWVGLNSAGLRPVIRLLESFDGSNADARRVEALWIHAARVNGDPIVNGRDGGYPLIRPAHYGNSSGWSNQETAA